MKHPFCSEWQFLNDGCSVTERRLSNQNFSRKAGYLGHLRESKHAIAQFGRCILKEFRKNSWPSHLFSLYSTVRKFPPPLLQTPAASASSLFPHPIFPPFSPPGPFNAVSCHRTQGWYWGTPRSQPSPLPAAVAIIMAERAQTAAADHRVPRPLCRTALLLLFCKIIPCKIIPCKSPFYTAQNGDVATI